MGTEVAIVTRPTVLVLAEMRLDTNGLIDMREWLKGYRPQCLPDEPGVWALFPYAMGAGGPAPSHNELLVELAGRKCYNSFGLKAGKKSNADYIANLFSTDVPHASVLYHAKMSFFIAGVSRRVSHELIRNYVGADRDEEGSPSQESTRYTHHPGHFVAPPRVVTAGPEALARFKSRMQDAYDRYLEYIEGEIAEHHAAKDPVGIERKRIYEAAAGYLPGQAATSWIWTTNPMALAKLFKERAHPAADLEFYRLAVAWKKLCLARWPNLFPQPWMKADSARPIPGIPGGP